MTYFWIAADLVWLGVMMLPKESPWWHRIGIFVLGAGFGATLLKIMVQP